MPLPVPTDPEELGARAPRGPSPAQAVRNPALAIHAADAAAVEREAAQRQTAIQRPGAVIQEADRNMPAPATARAVSAPAGNPAMPMAGAFPSAMRSTFPVPSATPSAPAAASTRAASPGAFTSGNPFGIMTGALPGQTARDVMPSATVAPQPAAPAAPAAAVDTSGAGGGRGFVNPATVQQSGDLRRSLASLPANMPAGVMPGEVMKTKDANGRTVYSGNNVKEGARIVNEDNRQLGFLPGLTSMPGANMAGGTPSVLADAAARGVGQQSAQPMQTEAGGFSSSMRGNMRTPGASDIQELAASGKLTASGLGAVVSARGDVMQAETQRRGQDVNERLGVMSDVTQQRGQDINANVSVRGQDMNARTAAAQARMQQMQSDRSFQLDVAKVGQTQAQHNFERREAGRKNFNEFAGSMFTTKDKDGKTITDTGKQADFVRATHASMGKLVTMLRAQGTPEAKAKADKLANGDVGDLDTEDRALLKTLFDRRERRRGEGGRGPFDATHVESDDLFGQTITGSANGLVQGRWQQQDGGSIGKNDLNYTEPANEFIPDWFKTRTNSLGPTPQEQALMAKNKGAR